MQIYVVAVGKVRERYLREGIEDYVQRLRQYVTLRVLEMPEEKAAIGIRPAEEEKVREREGLAIKKVIPEGAVVIALHPTGEIWSSEDLARHLKEWEISGPHMVVFLLGGELGLSKAIRSASDHSLSLSPMTFPHQLARLILVEQIYRAFRILRGEPYHR